MAQPQKALVVDDNRNLVKTLADILALKGWEVEGATSANQALQKLSEQPYDIVISDIRMPEMDGVMLYRQIKQRFRKIPFVLMTAYIDDQLVKEGKDEGVLAVISKPIDFDTLFRLMATTV